MNRVLGGLGAVLLLTVACSNAPGTSPGRSVNLGSAAPLASAAVDTAQEQLCDESNPAGLTNLADQIDTLSDSTDINALNTNIDAAITNLSAVTDASAQVVATTAATALEALQDALNDPNTREQAAGAASQALLAVDDVLCG